MSRAPEHNENFDNTNGVLDFDDLNDGIIVFDNILDTKQKSVDPFFIRGLEKDLDDSFLSPSYFYLPKK